MKASNLKDLLIELRSMTDEELEQVDMSSLPVFGGEEPDLAAGEVWSWDADNLLIGTQVGTGEFAGDFTIVRRDEA